MYLESSLKKVSQIPPFMSNNCIANTFTEKAKVLKEVFFPALLKADLNDLKEYYYSKTKACLIKITKQEILAAVYCFNSNKASGPDGIPNKNFQACANNL